MNILPKKSWHVWSIKNIEKVRHDEEQAAEEEQKRLQKVQLAEKEARTEILRNRAHQKRNELENNDEPIQPQCRTQVLEAKLPENEDLLTHINFFTEEETSGKCQGGDNKDHEREKKEEQEKYERQIGYLTYLGQGSSEFEKQQPWYCTTSGRDQKVDGTKTDDLEKSKKAMLLKKNIQHMDPMNDMRTYLAADKKYNAKKQNDSSHPTKYHLALMMSKQDSSSSRLGRRKSTEEKSKKKKKKSKKHSKTDKDSRRKRESKRTKTRSKSPASSDDERVKEKKRKLEALRAERLKREAAETAKTQHFIASLTPGGIDKNRVMSTGPPVREQYYNSQFNPHIARNPGKR